MSCRTLRNVLLFAVAVPLIPACTSDSRDSDDDDSGGSGGNEATPPLPANCAGPYACFYLEDGTPTLEISGKLVFTDGTCSFLSVDPSLAIDLADPEVLIDGRRFSLRGTVSGTKIALECDPENPSPAASKHCIGNAQSCSLDNCYRQEGCRYEIGYADNASDDRCSGSADSCSTFDSESDCEHQLGCTWA